MAYLQYAERKIPHSLIARDDGLQNDLNAFLLNKISIALDTAWSASIQHQWWNEQIDYLSKTRNIDARNEAQNHHFMAATKYGKNSYSIQLGLNHEYTNYMATNIVEGNVVWHRTRLFSEFKLKEKTYVMRIYGQMQQEASSRLLSRFDLSYTFLFSKDRLITAELKKSYRMPSLNELYWYEPGFANGNPHLEEEQSYRAELYFQDIIGKWAFKINPFVGYYTNLIAWSGFPEISTVNLAQVLSRGVDFHLNGHFKTNKGDWVVQHNQHWVQSTYMDKDDPIHPFGKQLVYTPVLSSNLQLSFSRKKWGLLFNQHMVSRNYYTSDNTAYIKGYLLSDLGGYWETKNWRIGAQVHNLFNEAYFTVLNRPMAGRYASINMSYNITSKNK